MAAFNDLTGQTFERLKVIKRVENYIPIKGTRERVQYLCQCDCDGENSKVIVRGDHLIGGKVKSCGCLHRELTSNRFKKYNTYDLTGEYGIGYTFNNEIFYFDLENYNKIKDHCWCINGDGYVMARINGVMILMHRLIMDCPDDMEVDHKFHNRFDNRKEFLRIVTHHQNGMNLSLLSSNTSGFTGVSWSNKNNKWIAGIMINNKATYLGSFINKDDAIKARLEAEQKYFGEFAPQQHLYEKYGIKNVK